MMRVLLILLFLASALCSPAQHVDVRFVVSFKGKAIGTLTGNESIEGATSSKYVKLETSTEFLFVSVRVESQITTEHQHGILEEATAYRNANRGASDVTNHIVRTGVGAYRQERNGSEQTVEGDIRWCIADLYFREPINVERIFSVMYGQHVDIQRTGTGRYHVTMPDKSTSIYRYRQGKLTTIRTKTSVGDVISRRTRSHLSG